MVTDHFLIISRYSRIPGGLFFLATDNIAIHDNPKGIDALMLVPLLVPLTLCKATRIVYIFL